MLCQFPARFPCQFVVVALDMLHSKFPHERDSRGRGQMRSRIARTGPVEFLCEALVKPPGNDSWPQRLLSIRAGPQHTTASRRPCPFMKIAGVPIDAQRGNLDGDCARRMSAIHENSDTTLPAMRSD